MRDLGTKPLIEFVALDPRLRGDGRGGRRYVVIARMRSIRGNPFSCHASAGWHPCLTIRKKLVAWRRYRSTAV